MWGLAFLAISFRFLALLLLSLYESMPSSILSPLKSGSVGILDTVRKGAGVLFEHVRRVFSVIRLGSSVLAFGLIVYVGRSVGGSVLESV